MKKTFFALVCMTLLLMLPSCKKNKRPQEKEGIETPDEGSGKKNYLPIRLESTSVNISLKYKEGTNLLTEIIGSDGNRIFITYTSTQVPLKLERYKNTTLLKLIDYYKDGRQRINQCTLFNFDAGNRAYIPLGDINIDYNAKDQISNLKFVDDLNKLTKELRMSYNGENNLSLVQLSAPNSAGNTFTYAYDQQMGIYKHVPYAALFAVELEGYFLNCSNNNAINFSDQKNTLENTVYTYEYNQNGYPISIKISKNKTIQQFKISYAEISG